uniref:uncharacterized protein LOC122588199 n=1 Tax=Erigeron canadensis TaxID=72917 RepID=UPI001CB8B807|nr:uncharacterized protein LOC122588199 [Erigeron canadensis]
MPPYEMLYGRKCRTPICWGEVGQRELGGTDVVLETTQKIDEIRERLKAAQDRQKLYADVRRRPIEFMVGDRVMLNKCLVDDATCVPLNEIELDKKLTYVEEPVAIVEEELRRINNKTVRTFKVQWKHHKNSKYTWETEHDMLVYYPSLHMAWITGT